MLRILCCCFQKTWDRRVQQKGSSMSAISNLIAVVRVRKLDESWYSPWFDLAEAELDTRLGDWLYDDTSLVVEFRRMEAEDFDQLLSNHDPHGCHLDGKYDGSHCQCWDVDHHAQSDWQLCSVCWEEDRAEREDWVEDALYETAPTWERLMLRDAEQAAGVEISMTTWRQAAELDAEHGVWAASSYLGSKGYTDEQCSVIVRFLSEAPF